MEQLRLAPLHLVADGVHQVGLAHADAAVEKERIVGLRWALGDGFGGGAGELVAVADDEGVEGVARVELRRRGPVETWPAAALRRAARSANSRRGRRCAGALGACVGTGANPPSSRTRASGRIFFRGDEGYVVEFQLEGVDGLLNEVAVAVAYVLELGRGNAHEEHPALTWLKRVGLSQVSKDCRLIFFSSAPSMRTQGLSTAAGVATKDIRFLAEAADGRIRSQIRNAKVTPVRIGRARRHCGLAGKGASDGKLLRSIGRSADGREACRKFCLERSRY